MPIQPFNVSKYQEIPDDVDITPLDNTIAKKAKKTIKVTLILLILGSLGLLLMFFGKNIESKYFRSVDLYQTSSSGDKLTKLSHLLLENRGFYVDSIGFGNSRCIDNSTSSKDIPFCDNNEGYSTIFVDSDIEYQEIIGFGGAFTESSAHNFYKFPLEIQEKVLDLYFGKHGIRYTLGRIHINSCDFSNSSYSFDDVENDYSLDNFDYEVTHDRSEMIPFIQEAMKLSPQQIKLVASPWSPPAWMKKPVNGVQSMLGSAYPNGLLDDPKVKASWALYISKFIQAYADQDVPIWAITPQNEPEFPAPWEACAYNASSELEFINKFLGPIVKTNHPRMLILAFDHNKDHLKDWAQTIVSGDEGPDYGYVDGLAFHWYTGEDDRLLDGTYGYENVNWTHHFAPNKILLATEGCNCPGVLIDSWLRAERLGHDVIFDLLNYAQGWIDWNLIVDSQGGPNHLNNDCDAPIIALPDFSDIHIQPKFYYFGHISKYVTPGSTRIKTQIVGNYLHQAMDPNTRAGIELRLFACEKSSRQSWSINSVNHTVALTNTAVVVNEGHADSSVNLCIGRPFKNKVNLKLSVCDSAISGVLQLHHTSSDQLKDIKTGLCVEVADGIREPGALLHLARCISNSDKSSSESSFLHQRFTISSNGEIKSKVEDMCVTAGWPFLTGVAFKHLKEGILDETVVVLMNEASVETEYLLYDKYINKELRLGINARSIQTIVY